MGRMEKKTITISVGPSVILLALLVLCAIFLFRWKGNERSRKLSIDDTPVLTTRIRTLGELTTACFYDEMVISAVKANVFSVSPLGSIAREGFGKDVDDHLVIIVHGMVRAGIDLQKLEEQDVRIAGDSVIVRLPKPQYLDVIVNPSDVEVFAESGKWTQGQVSSLQDNARKRLLLEANQAGLIKTAYERAEEAVSDLLIACGYTYIRFEQPGSFLSVPAPNGPGEQAQSNWKSRD